MPYELPNTWRRRKRQAQGGADVYTYDSVPRQLRVQVVQILGEGLGAYWTTFGDRGPTQHLYEAIVRLLRRELGRHSLVQHQGNTDAELMTWFEAEKDVDAFLEGIEICMRLIDVEIRTNWQNYRSHVKCTPDNVIGEINARMQEAGVGYQYTNGIIVRIDSTFMHKEVVSPVLELLSSGLFAAANQEFRDAHEAYRNGEFEDAITDCNKALESVLKVIGHKRGWPISDNDTASKLIKAAADADFLPTYLQAEANHLRGLLESSVPAVRNKSGGHGAGAALRNVPRHLVAFQLHQTAAIILFLAEQHASTP